MLQNKQQRTVESQADAKKEKAGLDLQTPAQLARFIEIVITEQAQVSHQRYNTPDFSKFAPELAARFSAILHPHLPLGIGQREYSRLFEVLILDGMSFFNEKGENMGQLRVSQMLNVWSGQVLGEVDNHRSLG